MKDELINGHFTSYFITAHQLFKVRVVLLVTSVAMLSWIIAYNFVFQNPPFIVKYFTNLSWIGLVIYFLVMVLLSYRLENMLVMSDRKKYWAGIALEALVAITQTVTWMVVLVYWILLSKDLLTLPSIHQKIINVVEHAIDLFMVVIEMTLTKSWLKYYSFVFPLAVAWFYTFWTWIFVYAGIWDWPYNFFRQVLDPNNKAAWITAVAILGGSVVVIVIYFIPYVTFRIREYYGKKRDFTPTGTPKEHDANVVQVHEPNQEA